MNQLRSIFLILLISSQTYALQSQMPSSVRGLKTPNVHMIADGVYRGNAPVGDMDDLVQLEIENVLIFKSETKDEVQKEMAKLYEMGFSKKSVKHIPFQWKEIENYETACVQVVEALRFIEKAQQSGAVYFHCTVGEDRTGALAGLYRMQNDGWSLEQAFQDEMCARGYEAGDKHKPRPVVEAIRRDLTPLFVALGQLVEENGKLTKSMCKNLKLPEIDTTKEFVCE